MPVALPFDFIYKKNFKLLISLVVISICILFIIPIMILLGFQLKSTFCKSEMPMPMKDLKTEKSLNRIKTEEEKALLIKE
jgi:hypothetical protein